MKRFVSLDHRSIEWPPNREGKKGERGGEGNRKGRRATVKGSDNREGRRTTGRGRNAIGAGGRATGRG